MEKVYAVFHKKKSSMNNIGGTIIDIVSYEYFTAILIGLGFPLFFVLIAYIMGRFGGWNKLVMLYKFLGPVSHLAGMETKYLKHLSLNGAIYNGGIKVTVTSQGIYLRPIWYMRFSHPTLFIPWNEIRKKGDETYTSGPSHSGRPASVRRGVVRDAVSLSFDRNPDVNIVMDKPTAEFILGKKVDYGF